MQVKKRDGRLQEFDRDKLKNSFTVAGAGEEEAEKFTGQVEAWAQEAAVDNVIESQAIWEKVVEILEGVDEVAAERYKAYRGSL